MSWRKTSDDRIRACWAGKRGRVLFGLLSCYMLCFLGLVLASPHDDEGPRFTLRWWLFVVSALAGAISGGSVVACILRFHLTPTEAAMDRRWERLTVCCGILTVLSVIPLSLLSRWIWVN